jgi:hypothetical protein
LAAGVHVNVRVAALKVAPLGRLLVAEYVSASPSGSLASIVN